MGLIFRLVRVLGLLFTLAVFAAIGLAGYLLIEGGADRPDCAPPDAPALEKATKTLAFDAKLAAFVASGGRLPGSGLEFGEQETQARAERYFEGRTDRITDVALCFEDGKATGFARVDTALGRKVGVKAEGSLELSGQQPVIRLTEASAGGLGAPSFMRRELEELINDQLKEIALAFPLDLRLRQDEASVSRSP